MLADEDKGTLLENGEEVTPGAPGIEDNVTWVAQLSPLSDLTPRVNIKQITETKDLSNINQCKGQTDKSIILVCCLERYCKGRDVLFQRKYPRDDTNQWIEIKISNICDIPSIHFELS